MKSTHENSTPENNVTNGDSRRGAGAAESVYITRKIKHDKLLLLGKGSATTSSPTTVKKTPKKRSLTKSLLEMLHNDDHGTAMDDSTQQQSKPNRQQHKQQYTPSASSTSATAAPSPSVTDRIAPKSNKTVDAINNDNSSNQQDVTHTYYSPLDYRPEKNPPNTTITMKYGGVDDDDCQNGNDDTTMLQSCVDQWTTEQISDEPMDADHPDSRNATTEKNWKKEELADDLSSLVASSSWDWECNLNHNYGDFISQEGGRGSDEYSNDNAAGDGLSLRPSWENNFQSQLQQSNMKEELEVEYGQLALLMQELEHKKHLQTSVINVNSAGNEFDNAHDSVLLPLSDVTDQKMIGRGSMVTGKDDTQTIRDQLHFEYGQLAVLMDDLNGRIKGVRDPSNFPNGTIKLPAATSASQTSAMMDTSSSQGGQCLNEDLAIEYSQLASLQQELARKMQLQKFDATQANQLTNSPISKKLVVRGAEKRSMGGERDANSFRISADLSVIDDDAAFGEMVYRQRMTEQNEEDDVDHQERYARRRRERYPRKRKDMEYYILPSDFEKKKKKRKRRFVETITRVIHEESEEEGSSSTGGKQGLNYRYNSPRKYYREKEVDDYYYGDNISSGERKDTGKRLSGYRKRRPNSGSRTSKSHNRGTMNCGQVDGDFGSASTVKIDARDRTTKTHGQKSINPSGRHFGYASTPVKMRQKHGPIQRSRVSKTQASILESLH